MPNGKESCKQNVRCLQMGTYPNTYSLAEYIFLIHVGIVKSGSISWNAVRILWMQRWNVFWMWFGKNEAYFVVVSTTCH